MSHGEQGITPPQAQRVLEHPRRIVVIAILTSDSALRREMVEFFSIHGRRRHGKKVAALHGVQWRKVGVAGREPSPHLCDVGGKIPRRRFSGTAIPQQIDEPVPVDRDIRIEQEQREQLPVPRGESGDDVP
nr:hypothetical protein [Microbispora hainanensis]